MQGNLFYKKFSDTVNQAGGFHNAHLHLDRAYTLDDGYVDEGRVSVLKSSHISLQRKHALIATVHESRAYDQGNLMQRFNLAAKELIDAGTSLADTMVDVTDDRVGIDALTWIQEGARQVKDKINIRAASYTPLGFKKNQPSQWEIFEKGVKQADFIGSLPEADDINDYPENIGFEEHLDRMLDLTFRTGKLLHVHTDQRNEQSENGTERLIQAVKRNRSVPQAPDGAPLIWAVHMISPSTYDDARWDKFVEELREANIGVITCPSAALAMRQLRNLPSPTYNSIPRILELAAAGVPIRIGSDNVADMCSPSTTLNLRDEILVLSAAIRFFDPEILGLLAAGKPLDEGHRDTIKEHLRLNDVEMAKLIQKANFGERF